MSAIFDSILVVLFTFLSIAVILYLSYFATKVLGTRTAKFTASKCMQVVDRLVVAQDKSILIVRADKKYYMLSLSSSDIRLIKELEDFDEATLSGSVEQGMNLDFKGVLRERLLSKKK